MAQTIGQQLQTERKKRGFSIADVAHDTRIHADTIRGLEADDYSVFSSTTYARSFLQLYSRHLEVDAEDTLQDFATVSENLNSGKISYLKSVTDDIEPGETIHSHTDSAPAHSYGSAHKQPVPIFMVIVVFLLVLIIPVFYFVGKKADSIEEAQSIFKDALSTKGQSLIINQDQQSGGKSNPPEQAIMSTEPDQATSLSSDAQNTTRSHRYPRPLPESKPTPKNSTSLSGTPLKAIPVASKKSVALEKTDTAQNRN